MNYIVPIVSNIENIVNVTRLLRIEVIMSNMYEFVKTRNYIGGECIHQCSYCYVQTMKKRNSVIAQKYSGDPFLCDREFKKGLGKNNTWFIGSCIDMFAENIPALFVHTILNTLTNYNNTYFLQSKNPKRFLEFTFTKKTILCTTVESNCIYDNISKAPNVIERLKYINVASMEKELPIHITIEPIMDFDLNEFVEMLRLADPIQINIGADSKGHKLPEPSSDKIKKLITELEKFTTVYQKQNLKRLLI